MEESLSLGLVLPLCVAVGLLGYTIADILRVPGILFYLVLGVLMGPSCLDLMPSAELTAALPEIVPVAAAIILFEGALSLDIDAIRDATKPLRGLLTWGAVINFLGASAAARLVGGLELGPAFVFGALMVVTGPTVITPILRRTPLVPRVRALLHWEAILIDPLGVVLGVLALAFVVDSAGEGIGVEPLLHLAVQLAWGTGIGASLGLLTANILKRPFFSVGSPVERSNLLALSAGTLAFVAGNAVIDEGGIVAATAAGLVLGAHSIPMLHGIREFKEQITTVLVAGLFVALAASVPLSQVTALGWPGLAVVVLVALVVRPLAVLAATFGSGMSLAEKAAVAWIGPRGIIAAAVAALGAIELHEHGVPGGEALQALVFATIAGTVVVQGLSARWVTAWLGVADPEAGGVLLVGGPLGPDIARVLRQYDVPVVIVDTNHRTLATAREHDVAAVTGLATDRAVLEQAYEEHAVESLVAMTRDPRFNAEVAAVGREVMTAERVFRADLKGVDDELRPTEQVAFLAPLDLDQIIHEWEEERACIGDKLIDKPQLLEVMPGIVPMFVVRDGGATIAVPGMHVKAGDVVIFLVRVMHPEASMI